jgi:ABC-type sugar transport system substrate-binding protein
MSLHRLLRIRAQHGAAILGLGAALVAASGCGSDSGGGGSAGNATNSAGVAEAQALVTKGLARPTSVGLTKPVGKAIPKGKKVVFISCGAQACEVQGSPEQLQNAFQTAMRQGANAIILNAVDRATLSKQIAEAKQKGVAFVTSSSVDPVGDGILYNTSTSEQNARIGEYMAAQVVAESKGKADTLYVNISAFQILKTLGTSYQASLKKFCSDCGYASIDIPLASLGKDAPDRIVSYLRSHPKVNYVVLSVSNALGAGLPAALRAAGLGDKVKVIGQGADTQTFQDIQSGQIKAVVPFDYYAVDYLMLDALARHFAGVPVQATAPPLWIMTEKNLPATTDKIFPIVESYRDQFKKLWGSS